MEPFFNKQTIITDGLLEVIAHIPTKSLSALVEKDFLKKLTDRDFMRIAVFLAKKSYQEGGCPIGGVVVDTVTREILGKGHNTLVQENNPYNHGETSAIRDSGRKDFSRATIFTTLSPCDICTSLIYMRGFKRVVIGDITNASGNETVLKTKGIQVDILEDTECIALYATYKKEKPELDQEDWKGLRSHTH